MKRLIALMIVAPLFAGCVEGEPDFSSTFDLILVRTGEVVTTRNTLLAQSNVTLSGTLTDAGGSPLDNAVVAPAVVNQLTTTGSFEATTDSSGAWQLTATPRAGDISLTVFVTRNSQSVGTFLWTIGLVPESGLATVGVSTIEGTAILNTSVAISSK